MLVLIEDQHRLITRRFHDVLKSPQLRFAHRMPLMLGVVHRSARELQELVRQRCRRECLDVRPVEAHELVAFEVAVRLGLGRGECYPDVGLCEVWHPDPFLRLEADGDIGHQCGDLLVGSRSDDPVVDHVTVGPSRAEVLRPVGSYRASESLSHVDQPHLRPEVHVSVR